jgi:UDP-glucuronate 4-epimerase
VLVTGGAGFVGHHLSRALLDRGDEVVVLDNLDDAYDPRLKGVPDGAALRLGDVRDEEAVVAALDGVDAVAHLAARAGVRESLGDPVGYASVNVDGTAQLLRSAARLGVKRAVFASSSSVYGVSTRPMREDEPADHPASPYAATKRAAERVCEAAALPVTAVRLFTVYGPRQRPGMAFARFLRQIRAGEAVTVFGDGASIRDYTFVTDAVAGLIRALDATDRFRVVNIGGGGPVTLLDAVATLGAVLGVEPRLRFLAAQPGDVPATRADISRAAAWLGWQPEVTLREGLARFVRSQSDRATPGGDPSR